MTANEYGYNLGYAAGECERSHGHVTAEHLSAQDIYSIGYRDGYRAIPRRASVRTDAERLRDAKRYAEGCAEREQRAYVAYSRVEAGCRVFRVFPAAGACLREPWRFEFSTVPPQSNP